MIGHYIDNLMPCEEDRLLMYPVGKLDLMRETSRAGRYGRKGDFAPTGIGPGCILQVATGDPWAGHQWSDSEGRHDALVEYIGIAYDDLLHRFGASRLNAAIRNRILSNRARRVLQNIPVLVGERTT